MTNVEQIFIIELTLLYILIKQLSFVVSRNGINGIMLMGFGVWVFIVVYVCKRQIKITFPDIEAHFVKILHFFLFNF